jgi:hypothetical protein
MKVKGKLFEYRAENSFDTLIIFILSLTLWFCILLRVYHKSSLNFRSKHSARKGQRQIDTDIDFSTTDAGLGDLVCDPWWVKNRYSRYLPNVYRFLF